ncbi:hypothetical protein AB3N59_02935 [Leptospira sp. WS92.C1]
MIKIRLNTQKIKLAAASLFVIISVCAYLFFFKGKCEGNCENGFGSKLYWDGKKYIGQWKDGEYDGFGVLVAKDRKIIFSGKWEKGQQTTNTFQIKKKNQ